ncbi:52 kDa repressor of the inhibitor of the protein kinase-like [Diadema setosum]|uniref:52 kDa repressor of the inhibitor of the protein kinase-like n=1 Tax=Diadema setosum TaxID=31175 RepID=UPI003B3BE9AB
MELWEHKTHQTNNLLDCASAIVRERILDTVRKAGVWSVLADETMDRKKREQLTIAVRYVEEDDMGRMTIQESPICIVDVLDEMIEKEKIDPSVGDELTMSGKNIASVILAKLKDFNLDLEKLVGQGYDGASSMASQQVGVAAKVREQAPHAEYFHCAMHMLNLCATKTTEVVPVRNCLDTIQQITAFFNSSAKRVKHLEAEIDKAGIDHHQRKRLKTLCQTRFLERHEAVINLLSLLPHIISTLDQMSAWQTSDARRNALSLSRAIASFDFVMSLHVLAKVSSILLPASRGMQTVGMDLLEALDLVSSAQEVMQAWRDDGTYDSLFQDAVKVANASNVPVELPRTASRSVYRPNNTGAQGQGNPVSEYFRLNVFLPLIDTVSTHLRDRFSITQRKIMHLTRIVPAFVDDNKEFLSAAEMYQDLVDTRLLEERTFSKVERTASAVRASMGEERLEALVLLQTHRSETPSPDDVIARFATLKSRRIVL